MAIRLDPQATIKGESAIFMSDILKKISRLRRGRHPHFDSLVFQGRGGEALSAAQLTALKESGMVVEEDGKLWLTPAGTGLKTAEFTPLYPLADATQLLALITGRMKTLVVDGQSACDAWLAGSVLRGEAMVGDLDLAISLSGQEPRHASVMMHHTDGDTAYYRDALLSGLSHDLLHGVTVWTYIARPGFECRLILHDGAAASEDFAFDERIFNDMNIPERASFEVDNPAHVLSRDTPECLS